MKNYNRLAAIFKELYNINTISSILHWDTNTMMPINSSDARSDQVAYLTKLSYKKLFNGRVRGYLEEVKVDELNDWQKANLKLMKRQYDNFAAVDCKLMQKFIIASNKCEITWRDARKNNDFKTLEPYLTEVVNLVRKIAVSRSEYFGVDPYQAMINEYEYGIDIKTIDSIFNELEMFLPSFIDKVVAKQQVAQKLNHNFSISKQEELCKEIMNLFGFNFSKGRLDVSTHPFCGGFKDDIRITTRYNEQDLTSGLYGVIHEVGHAMYDYNLPNEFKNQPVGQYMGMAIHESQSLFAEKQIGKSKEFISYLYPLILSKFELNEDEFSLKNMLAQTLKVKRSLIRVDADELTYPLHIIMRYQLEKQMIYGQLEVRDLPQAWNELSKKIIGVTPPSDSDGVMQDIHWVSGNFGYFPLYSIGAVIAAQLKAKIKSDLPSFNDYLRKGDLTAINKWLKLNVHERGSKYDFATLVKIATGEELNAKAFINHIKQRYDS